MTTQSRVHIHVASLVRTWEIRKQNPTNKTLRPIKVNQIFYPPPPNTPHPLHPFYGGMSKKIPTKETTEVQLHRNTLYNMHILQNSIQDN